MTYYDQPNRQAVGLDPLWANTGDNVPGVLSVTATGLDATASLTGGLSSTAYDLDWGDSASGVINTGTAGGGTASHTYGAAGTFTVTVTRSTDGASTSQQLTVTAPAGGGTA